MKYKRKRNISQGKQKVNLTISVLVMLFLVGITSPVFANTDLGMGMDPLSIQFDDDTQEISDQDLTRFGNTLLEIQQMEVSANNKIYEMVENSELSTDTLNELFAMQSSNPEEIANSFNEEEISEFNDVMVAINTIYIDTQKSMHQILEDHSYDLESFNQMAEVIQEDEQLFGRLQALFNEQG